MTKTRRPSPNTPSVPRISNITAVSAIAVFTFAYSLSTLTGCARQAQVAARGAQVMPFDLEQTIHVFQRLDDGGRQTVTVKDPANAQQIALIQSHLQHEADRFRQGDFSNPARIHGDDMLGLAELKTGSPIGV